MKFSCHLEVPEGQGSKAYGKNCLSEESLGRAADSTSVTAQLKVGPFPMLGVTEFLGSCFVSSDKRLMRSGVIEIISLPNRSKNLRQAAKWALFTLVLTVLSLAAASQSSPNERTFPQSKPEIEKIIRRLQGSVSGRLPTLEGFALAGDRPLDRYQKGFYQCAIQITPIASGKSKVRVTTKITAWYADPNASHSGYQTLPSNGRLENDLLDQIAEAVGSAESKQSATATSSPLPAISAPMPQIPERTFHGAGQDSKENGSASLKSQTDAAEKHEQELSAEAKGLEEILQNQSHPNNLAAVRTTGTPVLQNPNADAKILFPATAGDEFEILDMNSNWVHVRISGLSRGWIRRSALEMPQSNSAKSSNAEEAFAISNEQIAPFPGDWEPLRGKIVKIVTVQKANGAISPGAEARMKIAKQLLLKQYSQFPLTDPPSGVVIIFDSDDGGMIAATSSTLGRWQAGSQSDDAIWKECFFDPPELSKN